MRLVTVTVIVTRAVDYPPAPCDQCPKLWEDKVLAGFMPLKASLRTEDTFTIKDALQLSKEARSANYKQRFTIILCQSDGNYRLSMAKQ